MVIQGMHTFSHCGKGLAFRLSFLMKLSKLLLSLTFSNHHMIIVNERKFTYIYIYELRSFSYT